jgi:hypothetical protein
MLHYLMCALLHSQSAEFGAREGQQKALPVNSLPNFMYIYALGLEHTGHHLWHDQVFPRSPFVKSGVADLIGAIDASASKASPVKTRNGKIYHPVNYTAASKQALATAFREELKVYAGSNTSFYLMSCSYPCGSPKLVLSSAIPGKG